MNYIFGCLFLVVSTLLGYAFSKKYTLKRKYYTDFYDFNKTLKNEVSFTQNTLINIIKRFNFSSKNFENLIKNKFNKENSETNCYYLKKEEKEYLNTYLNAIGASDKYTQLDYLSVVDKQLLESLSNSKLEENKYKKIFVKVGFLIGLILFIIFL